MIRVRFVLAAPLVALALAVAVALGGCGGASGVPPATYVKSVCIALTGWRNQVQAAGTTLQTSITSGKHVSLTRGKAAYLAFVEALLRATTGTATQLKQAGVPAVNGGHQVASTLVQAFQGAQKALAGAASQATLIPTTDTKSYAATATQVTGEIRGALSSMTSVSPRHNAQLRAASDREPECAALKTTG
mgnify:CR=1 FL=1